jgi:hypothetical protein
MPTFEITAPDGRVFEVTAPEGATQDQVLSYAKSQFTQPKSETPATAPQGPSLKDRVVAGALRGGIGGIPGAAMGALKEVMPAMSKAYDQFAYDAGGKVTELASNAGLPAEGAAGVGFAANVGLQAVPTVLGSVLGATALATPMKAGATKLMQSALKPPLADLKTGRAATAIQTMLDEGLNVTKGGVAALREKIGDLNREIVAKLAQSPGSTVDKRKVAGSLKDLSVKVLKQANPQADSAAVRTAWDDFLAHPLLQGGDQIPVQLAQELKQGTYKALGGKAYGELKGVEIEAQKALARGLKDEIASAVPGIAKLNEAESKLLTTLSVAERRILVEANKNPMGLALIAHNPASFAAFLADRSAAFKSILARMMNAGSFAVPEATIGTGAAVGQGMSSRQ